MSESLVILLHGVGSSGRDLAPLGRAWQAGLAGTHFAAPDAPYGFDHGPGHQWFSVTGVTPENRIQRIAAARADFDRMVTALIEQHGLSDRLDRVALVGFSQGSIMALDAIATGRWPVTAVLAFSGRLAPPVAPKPSVETKVLLVHGDADRVIPVSETVEAVRVLHSLGLSVQSHVLPGVGHTITRDGAALGGRFLESCLNQA
jgi:phospholipase/carboxylesterase